MTTPTALPGRGTRQVPRAFNGSSFQDAVAVNANGGGGDKFPIRGERPDCRSVGATPLCMGAEAVAVAVILPLSIPPGGDLERYVVLCLWWQASPLAPEAPACAAEAGQVHRWPPEKLCQGGDCRP